MGKYCLRCTAICHKYTHRSLPFFLVELVPGENAFLAEVQVVAGHERDEALHFFAAVRPLTGETLEALGAPRAVREVGDPM